MAVRNDQGYMFSVASAERKREQERIEKTLSENKNHQSAARKVSMNITLSADHKEKIQRYAKEKHLSASVLIQMWIDEHCV